MTTAEPSPTTLRWAAEPTGSADPARVVRQLAGGTHAVTHLVRTARPARRMVLHRYPAGDTAATRQAAVLTALDGLDGLAPELIAADPTGQRTGTPATLITCLPGRTDLTSMPPEVAAEQLGRVLARIHAVPLDRVGPLRDLPFDGDPVLTHFDFWAGNVLWTGREITGVVDWSGACRAPRGFDVGWARLDLFLLHGAPTADMFLNAYQRAAGTTVPDVAFWDRRAVTSADRTVEEWHPNYASLGRADLTAAELRARHTAWSRYLPVT
ncbi:phosphotransferase family protein [Actinoplanes couchii]|uniref:Aminoglycoside phosphotransferase domain-containing protein n=1 Tax=Actinoplanes couchii TaxID=403638 RepID=A0ABQ3XP69_9ACTN|nr:aminoglycoside phosphotransferase family protein [Actinoplanes couchii]MDR6315892.1 aminoglycoside phosphotransferase (APT) family kinase protein [Actinoplanes couchii]GID60311.1 hypothetical protein Aco03nite_087150 [Actinoplanes couchii]